MTKKLYYDNSYLTVCDANILEIKENDEGFDVILDQTIFYPEGGGQPWDLGTIGGLPLQYVIEKDGLIYHGLKSKPNNNSVRCELDFERRFDHMQQHSGEHLLSGVFLKLLNGKNCGFHLGKEFVTIDINLSEIDKADLEKVEIEANNKIYDNERVHIYEKNSNELADLNLRKDINVEGSIRIVDMKEADICACCGTHVNRIGEIGLIKIIKTEKYKKMTRVYFKCGKRAILDYQKKNEIISNLKNMLSAEEDELKDKLAKLLESNKELKKQVQELKISEAKKEALNMISEDNCIIELLEDKNMEDINILSNILTQEGQSFILGASLDYSIIAYDKTGELNFGKIFKENIARYSGKGGGSKNRSQGTFSRIEDLVEFMSYLETIIPCK